MLQKIKFISSNPLKWLLKVQNEWMRQEFCRMALSLFGAAFVLQSLLFLYWI